MKIAIFVMNLYKKRLTCADLKVKSLVNIYDSWTILHHFWTDKLHRAAQQINKAATDELVGLIPAFFKTHSCMHQW